MIALLAVFSASLMCFTLLGIGLGFSAFGFVLSGAIPGVIVGFLAGYQRRETVDA